MEELKEEKEWATYVCEWRWDRRQTQRLELWSWTLDCVQVGLFVIIRNVKSHSNFGKTIRNVGSGIECITNVPFPVKPNPNGAFIPKFQNQSWVDLVLIFLVSRIWFKFRRLKLSFMRLDVFQLHHLHGFLPGKTQNCLKWPNRVHFVPQTYIEY